MDNMEENYKIRFYLCTYQGTASEISTHILLRLPLVTGDRKRRLDHSLTLYTKINSKWIKDLSVRQESIKILEENTGSNLFNLSHSKFFLETSPEGCLGGSEG